MVQILYAGCPLLSVVIFVQFTVEISIMLTLDTAVIAT